MHIEAADEATLLATIRTGIIPKDVLERPVRVDRTGSKLRLEPQGWYPRKLRATLRQAGLEVHTQTLAETAETVGSWPQIFGCEPVKAEPPFGTVLFVVPPGANFLELSGELLRLGGATQEWCSFATDGDAPPTHLIRITTPPYYVVLKALERSTEARAFLDHSGGVFVEIGFQHPLTPSQASSKDQLLLIFASGTWQNIPDGPWSPLNAHLQLQLPEESPQTPQPLTAPLQVQLRLERTTRRSDARLWVLRTRGLEALEALLRNLPSTIVEHLQFARLTANSENAEGESLYVLRSPNFGAPPPALEIAAEALAPRSDLPNLYLPVGQTLAPPLTTEQLRDRLTPQVSDIVWVSAGPPPRVYRTPETAFQPLARAVDYIIEQAHDVLENWVAGSFFDFDNFRVVRTHIPLDSSPTPKPSSRSSRPSHRIGDPSSEDKAKEPSSTAKGPKLQPPPRFQTELSDAVKDVHKREAEMGTAPPTGDESQTLRWVNLAVALVRAGRGPEASMAFARAALGPETSHLYEAWEESLQADMPEDFHRAAQLMAAAHRGESIDTLSAQQWLEGVEAHLPVHLSWLLRTAISRSVGGDTLGLLRSRDRLFQRIEEGLSLARDVPRFVHRLERPGESAPVDLLHNELTALQTEYQRIERAKSFNEPPDEITYAYVACLVRWGHARLGAQSDLGELPSGPIDNTDPIHNFVLNLIEARTQQASEGLEPNTPVPLELLQQIEALPSFPRFKIERLCQGSIILGTPSSADAFERYGQGTSNTPLTDLEDPEKNAQHLDGCLRGSPTAIRAEEIVTRLGSLPEALAVPKLKIAIEWSLQLTEESGPQSRRNLFRIADHLGRSDIIEAAWKAIEHDLRANLRTGAASLSRYARALVRAGLSTQLENYVIELERQTLGSQTDHLETRLSLAGVYATLGDIPRAEEIIKRELAQLESQNIKLSQLLSVIRALSLSLAQTSAEYAIGTVKIVFPRLKEVTDQFSTNSHYCISVLHFMESMILALTGRGIVLSPAARRWLDEDERLLRLKIHEDLADMS